MFGPSRPREWQDHQFLENHLVVRVGGLRGSEVLITLNGQSQVVELEQQWTFGRRPRLRPWFRCPNPSCNRRCRKLHERDGRFTCRLCSGLDYRCRHHSRFAPAAHRVRGKLTNLPHHVLAREAAVAQAEIARSLRDTVCDLERRERRGKR